MILNENMDFYNQPTRIRAVVFASLLDETIDIHIGYGYGLNDGGGLMRVQKVDIPKDCRMPNTYLWVWTKRGDIVRIEKMGAEDIEVNKAYD